MAVAPSCRGIESLARPSCFSSQQEHCRIKIKRPSAWAKACSTSRFGAMGCSCRLSVVGGAPGHISLQAVLAHEPAHPATTDPVALLAQGVEQAWAAVGLPTVDMGLTRVGAQLRVGALALAGLAAHSRVVAAARDPKGGAQVRQHVFVSEGFHAGEAFGRGSTRMPNAY